MELYTAGTGNGQRAAIAVNECGVPCKIHVLNLGQGDQKAADYLKINPTARIPTLIDPARFSPCKLRSRSARAVSRHYPHQQPLSFDDFQFGCVSVTGLTERNNLA